MMPVATNQTYRAVLANYVTLIRPVGAYDAYDAYCSKVLYGPRMERRI